MKQDKYIWLCIFCGKITYSEIERKLHTKEECKKYLMDHSPNMNMDDFSKVKSGFVMNKNIKHENNQT